MKVTKFDDNLIEFSDGSKVVCDHEQDCCESNWADCSVLEVFYHGEEFDRFNVLGAENGFILELEGIESPYPDTPWGRFMAEYEYSYGDVMRVYVPCYSDQNGYYSNGIEVRVLDPNGEETDHVSLFAEKRVD